MISLYIQLLLVQCHVLCSGTLLQSRQSSTTLLFVTPAVNVPCPGQPCLTLSQYIEDQSSYFNQNIELHFLPGVHNLTDPLIIEGINITLLALIGSTQIQSKILSSEQAAIIQNEIQAVYLESL